MAGAAFYVDPVSGLVFVVRGTGTVFEYQGVIYAWMGGHGQDVWARMDTRENQYHIRWVDQSLVGNPFQQILPTAVNTKPQWLWQKVRGTPDQSGIASYHIDQKRWLRVTAYIARSSGYLEVPLIDANNMPWIAPEIPGAMVVRRLPDTTDRVLAPGATGIVWSDLHCQVRAGVPLSTANSECVQAVLIRKTEPVPHWVLTLTSVFNGTIGGGSPVTQNILVDILAAGGGTHATLTREVGTAAVVGHWKAELMWTQQAFNANTNRVQYNQRMYCQGALDVPNDPTGGFTAMYLTIPPNEGTVTGTNPFTVLPMVQVFGNRLLGSYWAGTLSSNWEPETWGMGMKIAPALGNTEGLKRMYFSNLLFDGPNSRYLLRIFNVGDNGATTIDAGLNRTFIVQTIGK